MIREVAWQETRIMLLENTLITEAAASIPPATKEAPLDARACTQRGDEGSCTSSREQRSRILVIFVSLGLSQTIGGAFIRGQCGVSFMFSISFTGFSCYS